MRNNDLHDHNYTVHNTVSEIGNGPITPKSHPHLSGCVTITGTETVESRRDACYGQATRVGRNDHMGTTMNPLGDTRDSEQYRTR